MDMFDGVTYAKGACVLHALRGLLGDEAWWKGIRRYVAAHKFQVVETDDFRKAMEAASGKDLKWFFDQWVYKAGHPELKVRWHFEDADKTVRVQVQQTQTLDDQTPLFRLPTTLEITEDVGKTRVVPIVIDGRLARVRDPGGGQAQDGPDRPRRLADQGARLREDRTRRTCSSSSTPRACSAGSTPREALVKTAKDKPEAAKALAAAWKREKAVRGQARDGRALVQRRRDLPRRLARGAPGPRGQGPRRRDRRTRQAQARRCVRGAPPRGLDQSQGSLRRTQGCLGLVAWKVKDADSLLADALKITADHHSIAATALELVLETPGAKARELAALYSNTASLERCDPRPSAHFPAWPRTTRPPGHPRRAGRRPRPIRAISGLDGRARAGREEGPARAASPARSRERGLQRALRAASSKRRSTP